MPRGKQGIISKLLSAGIGAGSEMRHRSRSGSSQSGEPSSSSAPREVPVPASESQEVEYEYLEITDKLEAEKLVNIGEAERVVKGGKEVLRVRKVDYDSDSDSEDDLANRDEAAWELDEMAERVNPPSYEEATASSPGSDIKAKEDEMIQRLVRMAGPPPQSLRQIPCPVILPQRRPGQKDRGFVRAYAPVLADCGISQDVFLRFLADWEKSSKVRLNFFCIMQDLGVACKLVLTVYRRIRGSMWSSSPPVLPASSPK